MNNLRTCPCGKGAGGGCFCSTCGAKLAGVARILISLIFVVSGIDFLLNFNGKVAWLADTEYTIGLFNLLPVMLMGVVGLALKLGGGLALLLGFKASRAAGLLAAYVALATLMFHVGEGELTNFLKNLAVIGGLMYIMAYGGGAWALCANKGSASAQLQKEESEA